MLELLAPAGNLDAVIAAVQNGADAVYMGFGDGFNARRSADNFTRESFAKAVRYCHIRGCKVYVTLNTLVGDREMDAAAALAQQASDAGADAILVQDLGLARVLRAALPDIPLHASTQMSIHNLAGVEAAAEMGITRAVLARELSLEQIRFISQHASIETEVFVHGALCFCYSGQCYMSALIGRRSGNRGACAQPCRMQYSMGGRMDEYPLSLRDNCLADYLQRLADAGVACVKIEGRMKLGIPVILVIEVEGAGNIKKMYPGATTIFVLPPDMQELERRLRCRGTEDEETIQRRLKRAEAEIANSVNYDEHVVNIEVDSCAESIYSIIQFKLQHGSDE